MKLSGGRSPHLRRWQSGPQALFADRTAAGAALAAAFAGFHDETAVVVGLARGGVVVAAALADALGLPLEALAVRKVRHPLQPEYGLGAVAAGAPPYVRAADGLAPVALEHVVATAAAEAAALHERLNAGRAEQVGAGRSAIVVDDGLATGATMIAGIRWARARGATHVVAAAPVGAWETVERLGEEADDVVCPYAVDRFAAVGLWYSHFEPVEEGDVIALLDSREGR